MIKILNANLNMLSARNLFPTLVVALGLNGLIGHLLDIKTSQSLSYLLLTTPLPLAYSSPEISAQVEVTGVYRDGYRVSRSVTRAELGEISGPFQRRTPLIYVFTRPHQLGVQLVHPTLTYLFCTPGAALAELRLKRSAPLDEISWRVSYRGLAREMPWRYRYHCPAHSQSFAAEQPK